MEKLLIILVALKQVIKQYHWLAKSYQEHILADKLEEDLEDYSDEVAELALVVDQTVNVEAKHLLERAANYLNGKPVDLQSLGELFTELLEHLQSVNDQSKLLGISDLTGRLSNSVLRKLYLIKLQLGK